MAKYPIDNRSSLRDIINKRKKSLSSSHLRLFTRPIKSTILNTATKKTEKNRGNILKKKNPVTF